MPSVSDASMTTDASTRRRTGIWCRVQSCCFFIPLRTGIFIITTMEVILLTICVYFTILSIVSVTDNGKKDKDKGKLGVGVMAFVTLTIEMLLTFLLLIGACLVKSWMLKPWVYSAFFAVMVYCIHIGFLIAVLASDAKEERDVGFAFFLAALIVLTLHGILIVSSYTQDVEEA